MKHRLTQQSTEVEAKEGGAGLPQEANSKAPINNISYIIAKSNDLDDKAKRNSCL